MLPFAQPPGRLLLPFKESRCCPCSAGSIWGYLQALQFLAPADSARPGSASSGLYAGSEKRKRAGEESRQGGHDKGCRVPASPPACGSTSQPVLKTKLAGRLKEEVIDLDCSCHQCQPVRLRLFPVRVIPKCSDLHTSATSPFCRDYRNTAHTRPIPAPSFEIIAGRTCPYLGLVPYLYTAVTYLHATGRLCPPRRAAPPADWRRDHIHRLAASTSPGGQFSLLRS